MRSKVTTIGLASWMLGLTIATVLAGGIADAATGGTFLLGRSNGANQLTKLTNTRGTALSLVSPRKSPPLAVSNSRKVTRLNADLLDGLSSTAFQRHFRATIVVSPGATARSGGTALKAAVNGISDTNTKPLLIQLEPGTYDLGAGSLRVKRNVAIVGSGPGVTSITSSAHGPGLGAPFTGTVNMVPHSSLSRVTVLNTSTNSVSQSIGLAVDSTASGVVSLRDVNLYAFAGNPSGNFGVIFSDGSGTLLADDIEVRATGGAGIAFDVENGTSKVRNSLVAGGGFAIARSSGTVLFAASEIDGAVFGSPTCVGSYDANYAAITTGCV
jgi:hypothetical protein